MSEPTLRQRIQAFIEEMRPLLDEQEETPPPAPDVIGVLERCCSLHYRDSEIYMALRAAIERLEDGKVVAKAWLNRNEWVSGSRADQQDQAARRILGEGE
jgi:hypothetical protein